MTSSGTYGYNPDLGLLSIEAYSRIQIRPTSLTAMHMRDAVQSANFLLSDWSTRNGPNLWEIELISFNLVQGTANYVVPANVVAILDWYIRLPPQAGPNPTDIVIYPISRSEYADQPNKASQALPTTVWWNRSPATGGTTINLWPTPDQNGPYILYAYAMTQMQDASLPNGATMDIPYRFLEAFAAGLASKLSVKYPPSPPNSAQIMKALADEAWANASQQDMEQVPLYVTPGLSSYFR